MTAPQHPPPGGREPRFRPEQLRLVGLIVVLAIATIAYRLVYATGFQRTAALYVGVPAILAIGLALLPRSTTNGGEGTVTGMIFKGSTLAMLIACVVLPEGVVCLLFAMPLVLLVAAVVGLPMDYARNKERSQRRPMLAVGLPLLLASLEGLLGTPVDPGATATATTTVEATGDEVTAALARPPTFTGVELPTFLTWGFNRPLQATGGGLAVGDTRAITFDGGTHDDHPATLTGMVSGSHADQESQMHLVVEESEPGRVVFGVTHDGTMLSRWVDLDRAVVTWDAVDADTTRVTWSLEYERLLYPTVYFGPLQGYGMEKAAGYLLDAVVVGGTGP